VPRSLRHHCATSVSSVISCGSSTLAPSAEIGEDHHDHHQLDSFEDTLASPPPTSGSATPSFLRHALENLPDHSLSNTAEFRDKLLKTKLFYEQQVRVTQQRLDALADKTRMFFDCQWGLMLRDDGLVAGWVPRSHHGTASPLARAMMERAGWHMTGMEPHRAVWSMVEECAYIMYVF